MRNIATLIKKDLLLESRSAETVLLVVFLSLLLSIVATFGVASAFLMPSLKLKIFPMLLWTIFIFTATSACGRNLELEFKNGAIKSLLFTGTSSHSLYLSKIVSSTVFTLIGFLTCYLTITTILGIAVGSKATSVFLLGILVAIGHAGVATIAGAITSTSRFSQLLQPLVCLPLLMPLFFCAVELSFGVLIDGTSLYSSWLLFLVALDAIYLSVGSTLYRYVLYE